MIRFWTVVRVAIVGLLAARAMVLLDRHQARIHRWLEARMPPIRSAPLPLGGEIAQRREAQRAREVAAAYGAAKAELEAARRRRLDVASLEALLPEALRLAEDKRFDQSLTLLNRIHVSVPRPPEPVVAARSDDPLPKEPELKPRAVRAVKRRRRSR